MQIGQGKVSYRVDYTMSVWRRTDWGKLSEGGIIRIPTNEHKSRKYSTVFYQNSTDQNRFKKSHL